MHHYDLVIIGGGIIGLATGLLAKKQNPQLTCAIIEKESTIASHQTGHNSGVIHSGIYYKPGSLKANNCTSGVQKLLEFCNERGIDYKLCGKVIVATSESELPFLQELYRRGTLNNVPGLKLISPEELAEIEPYAKGIAAIHSPNTGIIDFTKVAKEYGKVFQELGGEIYTSEKVHSIAEEGPEITIETSNKTFKTKRLINCAGLHADRIAHMIDKSIPSNQILPFRGEYYILKDEVKSKVNGLIYPVPNPKFPFLGVHLNRTMKGQIEAGPNAVLALAREGYQKINLNLLDLYGILSNPGFWKMAKKYWKIGAYEMYRSLSKKTFLKSLQRLVPSLTAEEIIKGGAGVRPQIVLKNGELVDDFVIHRTPRSTHVLNAPSPGATASLSIAEQVLNT